MHFLVGTVKSISWWFNSGMSEWDHSTFEWLGTPSDWEFSRHAMQCRMPMSQYVSTRPCIHMRYPSSFLNRYLRRGG